MGEGINWQTLQVCVLNGHFSFSLENTPGLCYNEVLIIAFQYSKRVVIEIVQEVSKFTQVLVLSRNYFELHNKSLLTWHSIKYFYAFILHMNIKGQILPHVSVEVLHWTIKELSVLSQ